MKHKNRCKNCILNNKCCCQKENNVKSCGIEEIDGQNKKYNELLQQGILTQEEFSQP